jgi:hypothetical protein
LIVLNLCCEHEHLFEGWFASAAAFEAQCGDGRVECPVCGSIRIARRPTAPYVNTGAPAVPSRAPTARPAQPAADVVATAMAILRRLGRNSEDVGERFTEEARRIHYGEHAPRPIKGQASPDEVGELLDEGILVLPLPGDDDLH